MAAASSYVRRLPPSPSHPLMPLSCLDGSKAAMPARLSNCVFGAVHLMHHTQGSGYVERKAGHRSWQFITPKKSDRRLNRREVMDEKQGTGTGQTGNVQSNAPNQAGGNSPNPQGTAQGSGGSPESLVDQARNTAADLADRASGVAR